jgi:hypothetical protein
MRLSVSVRITDDLTGAPVKGSNARVWIEGQKPPIKKDDGRSIFVDLPDGEYVINAEGGVYSRAGVRCTVSGDKAENITIRLLPNRLYPVPSDAVCVEGTAAPGAPVRVYSSDKGAAYKLLSDVKKGSRVIGIYHSAGINIEGKLLKVISPEEKSEFIRVITAENSERAEYQLADRLSSDYPKIGTVIMPVSECEADEDGQFILLLRTGADGSEMICETQAKKKTITKKIDLSGSKHIKADLTK